MNCKNCDTPILGEKKFCANCGSKVINRRITFSSVTSEFFSTFISWDNKFFKTVLHLNTNPQLVINGYLDGVRKRYMQPFAFMIIALSLYGIYMFFAKEQMIEYMEYINKKTYGGTNVKPNKFTTDFNKKWGDFTTNYFNVLTFGMVPFLALFNLLIFRTRNFIEHCIVLVYSYASYLIGFVIIAGFGLLFSIHFKYIYPITMVYMILYHMFCYKKMFQLSFWQIIYKTILFWLLMIAFFLILFIIVVIVGVILAKLNLISL
jgi:hypothetical protein